MDQSKIVKILRLMKMMTGNTTLTIDDLADQLVGNHIPFGVSLH